MVVSTQASSGFVRLLGADAQPLHAACAAYASKRGWKWFTAAHDLNLWGFRTQGRVGAWDDVLGLFWRDKSGDLHSIVCKATTDPGREGTAVRSDGFAVVPVGQHRGLWAAGTHKAGTRSAHRALVQARPLMVGRDAVLDGVAVGLGQSAAHGINMHAPWKDGLSTVGDASHGCTVTWTRAAHTAIMVEYDKQVAAGLGSTVTYTLVSDADLVIKAKSALEWRS